MSIVHIKNKVYGLKDNLAGIIATGTKRQMEALMRRISGCGTGMNTFDEWRS